MYTSQYGRGTALSAELDSPVYSCSAGSDITCIDCAAVLSSNGNELVLFVINKHLTQNIECRIVPSGLPVSSLIEWVALNGYAPETVNTADNAPVTGKPGRRRGFIRTNQFHNTQGILEHAAFQS